MSSVKDTRSPNTVLSKYSSFNMNDVLNDIFIIDELREAGDESGARIAYDSFNRHGVLFSSSDSSVDGFFSYLLGKNTDLVDKIPDKTSKSKHKKSDVWDILTDKEKLTSAIIIQQYAPAEKVSIKFDTLCKFLDMSHGRPVTLSNSEFAELSCMDSITNSNVYRNVTRDIVKKFPIPKVKRIKDIHETYDLPKLYDKYLKDNYFSCNYKIKNVYAIKQNAQSFNAHKQGRKHLTLNSGTSNESLIKILSGGFNRPSKVMRDNKSGAKISGQSFGDSVYFAKPEQISKNTYYMDRENPGSKFIVVANVYYDRCKHVYDYNPYLKYDGHNLVHAHDIGQYDRDEFMVAPEQIEVKYVLEVDRGRLYKPKKNNDKNYQLIKEHHKKYGFFGKTFDKKLSSY